MIERPLPAAGGRDPAASPVPRLPCPVAGLVPHRPPMLLVHRLLEKEDERAVVEAIAPEAGMFVGPAHGVTPEYLIEVIAQGMAAASGFDALEKGAAVGGGFLVGIDECCWHGSPAPGETLRIELEKRFQFDAVTVMAGRVIGRSGCLASATLKVWESDAA